MKGASLAKTGRKTRTRAAGVRTAFGPTGKGTHNALYVFLICSYHFHFFCEFLKNEEFPALASRTHSKKSPRTGKLSLPTHSFPLRPHLVLGLFLVELSPLSQFWLCGYSF